MSTRSRLAPQMRTYDALQPVYLPHLGFFQPPNFHSDTVNTDSMGFRHSHVEETPFDWHACNTPVDIVLGGSTAFGVGATSDRDTMASLLSRSSGRPCLNFGGRAFSSFQEMLLFTLFASDLDIRNLFVVSGINTLYLAHVSHYALRGTTGCFYEETFKNAFFAGHFGWKQRLALRLARLFGKRSSGRRLAFTDYVTLKDAKDLLLGRLDLDTLEDRYANALITTETDESRRRAQVERANRTCLATLAALCGQRGARLHFFLQPFATWSGCALSPDETALFAELDAAQSPLWETLREAVAEAGSWYVPQLEILCAELGVPFTDLNPYVGSVKTADQTFFVDRVHLTDLGYQALAKRLAQETAS